MWAGHVTKCLLFSFFSSHYLHIDTKHFAKSNWRNYPQLQSAGIEKFQSSRLAHTDFRKVFSPSPAHINAHSTVIKKSRQFCEIWSIRYNVKWSALNSFYPAEDKSEARALGTSRFMYGVCLSLFFCFFVCLVDKKKKKSKLLIESCTTTFLMWYIAMFKLNLLHGGLTHLNAVTITCASRYKSHVCCTAHVG